MESFCRLLAEDCKSPKTIESYAEDVAGFLAHLGGLGEEFHGQIKRSHVTGFMSHLLERGHEAATVSKNASSGTGKPQKNAYDIIQEKQSNRRRLKVLRVCSTKR